MHDKCDYAIQSIILKEMKRWDMINVNRGNYKYIFKKS